MQITEIRLSNVRNVEGLQLELEPGISEFVGDNGAGKTSLLESVFMLSHGRSFRSVKRESLIRFGAESLEVFALVLSSRGERRLGLSRKRGDWAARLDGKDVGSLAELLGEIAVVCFEPGSHALISGASEERRHFVDWALFHVEPNFADVSRRYRRALKQRNSLLRSGRAGSDLDGWDMELARSGLQLDEWRDDYLRELLPELQSLCLLLLPELGAPNLRYSRGWPAEVDLAEALRDRRERDLERGHTGAGPHRADWKISFELAPEREHLSRGQEKLCALAFLLSQAALFSRQQREWPIICLDDLASELDAAHQRRVLGWLIDSGAQVLVTGTAPLLVTERGNATSKMFHVEQGKVTRR